MMKIIRIKRIILAIILLLPGFCWAMMSSSNYMIDSDTINAGGTPSWSANYQTTGTVGEQATGESDSTNYGDRAGFWYTGKTAGLSLNCVANDVYMLDYTLGDPDNYSKHLFSVSERCEIIQNSATPWTLTISSSDMTSDRNDLSNTNIFLATDGYVSSGDTITSPSDYITEPIGPEYSLDSARTIISGSSSAVGEFDNRPTIKLNDLNRLYAEAITGTLVITLQ